PSGSGSATLRPPFELLDVVTEGGLLGRLAGSRRLLGGDLLDRCRSHPPLVCSERSLKLNDPRLHVDDESQVAVVLRVTHDDHDCASHYLNGGFLLGGMDASVDHPSDHAE